MNELINWHSPNYYEESKGMHIMSMDTFKNDHGTLRFCWWTKDGARMVRFVRSGFPSDWEDFAIELLKNPVKDKS